MAARGLRIGDAEREVPLKDQEKRTLRFPVEARAMPGVQTVTVKVAGNGINITRVFGLAVRPPTPQLQFTKRYSVKPGESVEIQDAALSGPLSRIRRSLTSCYRTNLRSTSEAPCRIC
jgi:uncharacterized protein YfaS (alpha-2-macroglobulin family)